MTIISKSRLIELAGYALALSSLLLTACGEAKEQIWTNSVVIGSAWAESPTCWYSRKESSTK